MTPLEEAALDVRRKLLRKRRVEESLCEEVSHEPQRAANRAWAYCLAIDELADAAAEFVRLRDAGMSSAANPSAEGLGQAMRFEEVKT